MTKPKSRTDESAPATDHAEEPSIASAKKPIPQALEATVTATKAKAVEHESTDKGSVKKPSVKQAAATSSSSTATPVDAAPAKVLKAAGSPPRPWRSCASGSRTCVSRSSRQAADLMAEAESLANEREQGDTQFDEESGEGDTLSVERERDLALSAASRQLVEEVERALIRLDDGTFGICVRCSKRIALARLEFIPHAAHCIECANRLTRRR